MAKKTPSPVSAYEVSERVPRQALIQPYRREPRAPLTRPLRIYTLDPSVSDRLGGVATVQVPYEKLEPGPVGSVFKVNWEGAPAPLEAEALNLDDPYLLLSSGVSPSPANGRFHLQMVYAICSLTYAAFSRALGRDIAWATEPGPGEPLRLVVRPFGFRGANAGYSREAGDLSFGYFTARGRSAGFTLRDGIVCTALSHDVVAHETTHALLDGLRSAFLNPTNVDVPAFHEGFSDLVALFLHFTYGDVVERGIRDSRGAFTRGSILTDLAREFGYARSRSGKANALRSGVDIEGVAAFDSDVLPSKENAPQCYDPDAGSARARLRARVGRVRGVHHDRQAKDGALLPDRWPGPPGGRPGVARGRARQGDRAGGERRRRAVPEYLHPGDRLLPAGRHGARGVPAGDHHRRRRPGEIRQVGIPRSADAFVPPPPDLSGSRAVHDGGRGAVAAARR